MTTKKRCFIFFLFLLLLFLAGGGLSFLLDKLLHLDTYKEQIIAESQRLLKRQVSYEEGRFAFRFGPSFTFSNVTIKEKDGTRDFISAEKITFKVGLLPLLEKKIALNEIILSNPKINVSRDDKGAFNFDDLLKQTDSPVSVHLKEIKMVGGSINFTDHLVDRAGLTTRLADLDLHLSHLSRGKKCRVKLAATVAGGPPSKVSVSGAIKIASAGKPLIESTADLDIKTKNFDVSHYWPYYMAHVPFKKILGRFDSELSFKGKLGAFTSKGEIRASGVRFDYPQVFHSVLTPKNVHVRYAMELTDRDIAVKSLDLTVDRLNAKGKCSILDLHSQDPRIVAEAVTSTFRLEEFAGYIPYGIIVTDTADFIEKHIKGGTYKLDEGRLNGRVSQILHMELGQNYNVLFIKGTVEKGLVSFGSQVPTFNTIKGDLEMHGKDFNLIRMSGNFGTSPFTLDGKIADYPLTTPSSYPFTMKILPRQPEATWLLGQRRGQYLTFAGNSELNLAGNGFTSGYNLSGSWNLNNAIYAYRDYLNKPARQTSRLSFKGSLNKEEAILSFLSYDLGPLHLAASAGYRYTGADNLNLGLQIKTVSAGDVVPMLPFIRQYSPTGKLKATVTGKGSADDFASFRWGGDIQFSGFALKPPGPVKMLSNMTGTIHFKGDELETSQLSVKMGSSIISGKGSLTGFKNPTLSLAFSSPALNLADIGYVLPTAGQVVAEKVHGSISLQNRNLQIKELSAQIRNSHLSIRGAVRDMDNPEIDVAIASPHLDLEDLLVLTKLQPTGKGKPTGVRVKAAIRAASGKYGEFPFKSLKTDALIEDKIFYLQHLEFAAFDGTISAKGRFDTGSNDIPHYQVNFNIDKVSADKVTRAIGMKKQEITGTLSLQGDLSAKGSTGADMKKTALGSVKIYSEEGSLRRFATLSKIFSILNVSQLLKLQLPDMVSGGMPYNSIAGTLAIRDGIVSTNDLFLDSDAMNISCVGKLDLSKEEIDATIGVQPLQTVDKVVSHIPIVGWILTGKDKTLVTAYFEAKGKIDDPRVSAIPVKYLAKGVFDIFRRMFELPAKLFTNTGEVIIGK
ncbi:AsmA-like C-terminal domain-containing protein [Geotalea sp. SG265]|uniref:YhdP family protein n=1 Tax=Geotalea sp. SG265 TaxID=2922867 RepID=UPI001FB0387F|nr:AsmA-like C-terminal domain-containing protein [Geotalea sp. SG265]